MTFRGWPAEALEFFEGLEADNSKVYWQRNRDVYDRMVRAPMEELLNELAPEWGESRIFRPYRDIRFSSDKSPYKTNIAAVIGDGYVHLSAHGLGAGCGMYEMAPDQLDRYRAAVGKDRSGENLADLVASARAAGLDVTGHEVLKTAQRLPKGPSQDRAPSIQGPDYVAGVARGTVAWNPTSQDSCGRVFSTLRATQRVAANACRSLDSSRAADIACGRQLLRRCRAVALAL